MAQDTLVKARREITPSDTDILPDGQCDGITVGVAGDVKYKQQGGTIITETLASGEHNIPALQIFATGTTATGLIALYTRRI